MYTAPESFYRDAAGTITTDPGKDRELVASCGAVMSKAEARERGLLPAEDLPPTPTPEPAEPIPSPPIPAPAPVATPAPQLIEQPKAALPASEPDASV